MHNKTGTFLIKFVFRPNETVYHYDSSRGTNKEQAIQFAGRLFCYFQIKGRFKEEQCFQQNNGYDCGIYLICNAEHLAKVLSETGNIEDYYATERAMLRIFQTMRQQLIEIIEDLMD